jgi:solute:Na+ symporter, SSS family
VYRRAQEFGVFTLSSGHLIGLFATLAAFVALAVYAARKVGSAEGFSLSGRRAGVAMVAGSIAGTSVAGASTIGTAQLAFSCGLTAWWFTLGVGLALIVMALFYARPLRASGLETLPQYLARHYGRGAGLIASAASSVGILFSAVASAISGIALIGVLFALTPGEAAAIIAALVIGTVFFGGIKGAGLAGLLKMAAIGLALVVAGVTAVVALTRLPDFSAAFPLSPWFDPFARGLSETVADVIALLVGMLCTQTYIQAIFAGRDTATAARGTLVAAFLCIPVGLPCVAIGMAMHASHPHMAAIYALPAWLVSEVPPLIGGIGLAGILFSVVGSIAGLALGIGTMIAGDFGRGLFGWRNGRALLWLNRFAVLAVTGLAFAIALANAGSEVLAWNYLSMALRGAGVFLPMALAVFWPKYLSGRWAAVSMAVATLGAVCGRFVFHLALHPLFVGLAISAVLVGAGIASSRSGATKP